VTLPILHNEIDTNYLIPFLPSFIYCRQSSSLLLDLSTQTVYSSPVR